MTYTIHLQGILLAVYAMPCTGSVFQGFGGGGRGGWWPLCVLVTRMIRAGKVT
jgi:hypothetical protein